MGFSYSVNVDGRVRTAFEETARLMPDATCESVTVTCEAMPNREYAVVRGIEESYGDYLKRVYDLWLVDAYAYMDTDPWKNASIEYTIVVETFGRTPGGDRDHYVRVEKLSYSKEAIFYVDESLADIIHVEVYGTSQADVDAAVIPIMDYLEDWMEPSTRFDGSSH